MLAVVLRMLGVDLQEQVSRLKAHVNEVAERVSDRVQEQIKETGVTLGLGLIGAVAAVSTIGIALAALFISVDQQSGRWLRSARSAARRRPSSSDDFFSQPHMVSGGSRQRSSRSPRRCRERLPHLLPR